MNAPAVQGELLEQVRALLEEIPFARSIPELASLPAIEAPHTQGRVFLVPLQEPLGAESVLERLWWLGEQSGEVHERAAGEAVAQGDEVEVRWRLLMTDQPDMPLSEKQERVWAGAEAAMPELGEALVGRPVGGSFELKLQSVADEAGAEQEGSSLLLAVEVLRARELVLSEQQWAHVLEGLGATSAQEAALQVVQALEHEREELAVREATRRVLVVLSGEVPAPPAEWVEQEVRHLQAAEGARTWADEELDTLAARLEAEQRLRRTAALWAICQRDGVPAQPEAELFLEWLAGRLGVERVPLEEALRGDAATLGLVQRAAWFLAAIRHVMSQVELCAELPEQAPPTH